MAFGQGLLGKIFLPGFADAGADASFQASIPPTGTATDEELPLAQADLLIQRFAPKVWTAEGPNVNFFGFPYPTRMVAIQLLDGSAWIWSPIALTEDLAYQVVKLVGPVKYIVSPNLLHWYALKEWQDRFPDAKVFASPGLEERKVVKDIFFCDTLNNETPPEYADDLDQIIFRGGAIDEVVFFHKPSKTVIFCDLIQRHFEDDQVGFKGWLLRAEGLVGPLGSTPKEWRFAFWIHGLYPQARKTLDVILQDWKPEGMVIAHGENAPEGACVVIENCLTWIPKDPKPCCCCPHRVEEDDGLLNL